MGADTPRATVVLMTHRHGPYIGEAVASYLAQEGPPIEILVCDDASPDDTVARAAAAIAANRGPHEARLVRHAENIGPLRNFLSGVDRARADFVLEAHGDDVAAPDRVARVCALAEATGASLVASDAWVMAPDCAPRRLNGPQGGDQPLPAAMLAEVAFDTRFLGATFAYEKRVFTSFPDLRAVTPGAFGAGDHFLPFRAALRGGVWYLDAPLVRWRQHAGQVTRMVIQTGEDGDESWRRAGLETVHAFGMRALLRRLDDLARVEAEGARDDIPALRAATVRLLLDKVGRWSTARARLEAAGQRLHLAAVREE